MSETLADWRIRHYAEAAAKVVAHLRSVADQVEREARPHAKPGVTELAAAYHAAGLVEGDLGHDGTIRAEAEA